MQGLRASIEACSRESDQDGAEAPCLGTALVAARALEAVHGVILLLSGLT